MNSLLQIQFMYLLHTIQQPELSSISVNHYFLLFKIEVESAITGLSKILERFYR